MKDKLKVSCVATIILIILSIGISGAVAVVYDENNYFDNMAVLHSLELKMDNIFQDVSFSVSLLESIVDIGYENFTHETLNKLLSPITSRIEIRNMSILPNGIVDYVCPIKGNEKAIGDNIFSMPERKIEAQIALETKETIVSGPYELTQGGSGLIARKAIFKENSNGSKDFWGIVAVVMDAPIILKKLELDTLKADGYEYMLTADVNGLGSSTIRSSDAFDQNKAISKDYPLPNGKWTISIHKGFSLFQIVNIVATFLICFLLTILIFIFLKRKENEVDNIKTQVYQDNLTGLYNRKMLELFESTIEKTLNSYSLFYCDLNYFKHINDTYGHHTGDQLLIQFSHRLKNIIRSEDYAIRIGGDEFIIILPNVSSIDIIDNFLKRLESLQQDEFMLDSVRLKATISYGYATYPNDAETLSDLLKLADNRMYEAKKGSHSK